MQIACNLEINMCVIDVLTQCLKTPFSAEPKLQYTHAPASVSNTSGKHVHAIYVPLNPTFIIMQNWRMHGYIRKTSPCKKKVQVGKDQEKAQSEKDSHSKNQGGKKPNQQSGTYTMKTLRKPNEQLFSQ